MKIIYILTSIGSFLLLIPISLVVYREGQVLNNGKLVDVELTYISRAHSLIRFKMDGKTYDKKIDQFSDFSHNIGDTLKMRYLKGYEDNFLFAEEKPTLVNIFLVVALLICGVGSLYYLKKGVKLW